MRRTLVNLSVAAVSAVVLAASWAGIVHVDAGGADAGDAALAVATAPLPARNDRSDLSSLPSGLAAARPPRPGSALASTPAATLAPPAVATTAPAPKSAAAAAAVATPAPTVAPALVPAPAPLATPAPRPVRRSRAS